VFTCVRQRTFFSMFHAVPLFFAIVCVSYLSVSCSGFYSGPLSSLSTFGFGDTDVHPNSHFVLFFAPRLF